MLQKALSKFKLLIYLGWLVIFLVFSDVDLFSQVTVN